MLVGEGTPDINKIRRLELKLPSQLPHGVTMSPQKRSRQLLFQMGVKMKNNNVPVKEERRRPANPLYLQR